MKLKFQSIITIGFTILAMATIICCKKTSDENLPPLKVVSVDPANNSTGLGFNPKITITFNKEVDFNNLASGISLIGPDNEKKTLEFGGTGNVITCYPIKESPLQYLTRYTLQVKGLYAADGALVEPFTSEFSTKDGPLRIVSAYPANGATNIPLNAKITITFSKPMNTNIELKVLMASPTVVTWSTNFLNGNKTIELVPIDLKKNMTYTIFFSEDLTAADGEVFAQPENIVFTTVTQ